MINTIVLICFGGIFIASFFMLFSFVRMALLEASAVGYAGLRFNRPFLLAASLVCGSMGLIGVAGLRTWDGLSGIPIGGSSPLLLMISLCMLWAAWTGFHWTAALDRAPWHWRLYVLIVALWVALLLWPYFAH